MTQEVDFQTSTEQTPSDSKNPLEKVGEENAEGDKETGKNEAPDFEEYDLSLPEDSNISDEEFDAIADFAGKNKLTKDQAEALIKFKEESFSKGKDYYQMERKASLEKKEKEFFDAPEMKGENRAKTAANIQRALKAFGSHGLAEALKVPEVGHSIHLARFLNKVGAMMGDDSGLGLGGGKESSEQAPLAQRWYGDIVK